MTDVAAPFGETLLDARTPAYRHAVLAAWREITGRESYDAEVDEAFDLDPSFYLATPYPYSSADPVEVGRYFGAVGWFMRTVELPAGARIVEFGAGWGHLSMALASTGFDVTAVDLNRASVELLRERCTRLGIGLEITRRAFLDDHCDGMPAAGTVDAVVFFEAFHHCDDPLALLDRCRTLLRPGGTLVLLAEPIYDGFHLPWGVRLDEQAVRMARLEGWLELGYQRAFLYRELNARGFALSEHRDESLGPYGTMIVAQRSPNTFAGVVAPDEQATWDERAPLHLPGRLATERSMVSLSEYPATAPGDGPHRPYAEATMVNLTDSPLRVSLDVADEATSVVLAAGQRLAVDVALPTTGRRRLHIVSDRADSAALGLDRVGVCVEGIVVR